MSPFRDLQQLDQEKKVVHRISSASPVPQSWSEMSSRNELREVKSAAETEDSVIAGRAESQEDRQWKEMKLRLDDLPGILARLSKIKLTGITGNFFSFLCILLEAEFFGMLLVWFSFACDNSHFIDAKLGQFQSSMC